RADGPVPASPAVKERWFRGKPSPADRTFLLRLPGQGPSHWWSGDGPLKTRAERKQAPSLRRSANGGGRKRGGATSASSARWAKAGKSSRCVLPQKSRGARRISFRLLTWRRKR